jgi:hypothetical protein
MKKFYPAEGTRFQRLMSLSVWREGPMQKNRIKPIVDFILALLVLSLIIFIWVALP